MMISNFYELTDTRVLTEFRTSGLFHYFIKYELVRMSYLELDQMHIHMLVLGVLVHKVGEVPHPLGGGPQPGLNLGQVQHHLPVGARVQGRGLLVPAVSRMRGYLLGARLLHLPVTSAGPSRAGILLSGAGGGLQGGGDGGDHG